MKIKVKKNKATVDYDENDRNRYILTTFGDVCDLDKKILTKQNIENINLLYLRTYKLDAELLSSVNDIENKKNCFQLDFGNYNFGLYLSLKRKIEINFWIGFDFSDKDKIGDNKDTKLYFGFYTKKNDEDFSFDRKTVFTRVQRGSEYWQYLPLEISLLSDIERFQDKIVKYIKDTFCKKEEHT